MVLVGVEAADDTLAMAVVDAPLGHQLDRHVGDRRALRIERHHLDHALVSDGRPILDLDPGHHTGRREFDRTVEGLDLAVRVGEAHFGVEFARPLDAHRQRDVELARAGLVERYRLLVGDQALLFAVVVDGEGRAALLVEIDDEVEPVVVRVFRPARPQRRRHLDLRALGGTAVEEIESKRQRHFARRDELRRRPLHAAREDGQPEVGDAELAGVGAAPRTILGAAHLDLVGAALGRVGNLPLIGGDAPLVPAESLTELVVTAFVADHQLARQGLAVGVGKAATVPLACDVLHRHRLAGTEQAAIENRVDLARLVIAPGLDAEAPRLDAVVPVGTHETVVLTQPCTGEDEALVVATRRREFDVDQCPPLRIAAPLPQGFAVAARDTHFGTGHRFAAVERGHPDQAVVSTAFEMHGHVGDQRRRAHVHRLRRREQRRTKHPALDLDDVEARLLQWNADHFELGAAAGLWQRLAGDAALVREEGKLPRVVGINVIVRRVALAQRMTLCLLLEFRDGLDRSDDFGVVGQTLLAEAVRVRGWQLQVSDRQFGFDVAQRHRQDAAFLEFENAKRAGELGQRRQRTRAHRQRKARGVRQRTPRLILQIGRQFDFKFCILREWPLEGQRRHGVLARTLLNRQIGRARSVGRNQADTLRLFDVERNRELDPHIGQRRARRVGFLALAGKARAERLTNEVGEPFIAA